MSPIDRSLLSFSALTCTLALIVLTGASSAEPDKAGLERDPIEEIRSFNRTVARSDLGGIQRKFEKMALDVHAFFRGTAHLFCRDMVDPSASWASDPFGDPELSVIIDGDAHLFNFGSHRTPDGKIVLDIIDFDGATPGPFVWDLRRLATSLELAAHVTGLGRKVGSGAADRLAKSYANTLERVTEGTKAADIVVDEASTKGRLAKFLREIAAIDRKDFLKKHVDKRDGNDRRLLSQDEVRTRVDMEPFRKEASAFLPAIAEATGNLSDRVTLLDAARHRGKGIGSLGYQRFYLLLGEATGAWDTHVILELKEAAPSEAAAYVPGLAPSTDDAERVVDGVRKLSPEAPRILGTLTASSRKFYARELSPWDQKLDLTEPWDEDDFLDLAKSLGQVLARSHAHGDLRGARRVAGVIAADTDGFRKSLQQFADRYYDQVKVDYHTFKDALKKSTSLGLGSR